MGARKSEIGRAVTPSRRGCVGYVRTMSKYGPSRGEHLFRLVFAIFGLAAIGVLIAVRGVPKGPGLVEVVGFAGLFFLGTLVLSARALLRKDQG